MTNFKIKKQKISFQEIKSKPLFVMEFQLILHLF